MADSSFDVVSKVDHQEADNALNQAAKEVEHATTLKTPMPALLGAEK